MSAWHDDEHFWSTFGPALETPTEAEAAVQVAGFVDLARLPPGGRVLDVGCGHGLHTLALARRGYTVTALDLSARRLRALSATAEAEGLEIDIVRRDMREFSRPRHFHAVLWAGPAVGIFEDPAEDARMVEQLFDTLKPAGRLVVSPLSKELVARGFEVQRWSHVDDKTVVLQTRDLTRDWARLRARMTAVRGAKRETVDASWRLFSGTELERLLSDGGFDRVRLFGGFDRRHFDLGAERLVAVCER
jgi:2-polyprenyl-3-methyl-5-hydroxy-6-metoxy-1,4-benzoquinol methylase